MKRLTMPMMGLAAVIMLASCGCSRNEDKPIARADKPCVPETSCKSAAGKSSFSQPLATSEETASQTKKRTANERAASNGLERLTPEQKVKRLMAQLRKTLGNSMEVTVALAALQEKVDQLLGDYKTKCLLQEMMGNSYRRDGIVPDLPDPNGNGALAEYLKIRGINNIGNIMCMYHMLTDQEQASVAEEVRKLMK